MFSNIQPFIDAGWYTIPLRGSKITRSKDGTSKEAQYPSDWTQYQHSFNDVATPVGAVIPGKESNIIVVDCDSTETTELFQALLPNHEAVAYGTGKKDKLGNDILSSNWYFEYDPDVKVILNGFNKLEVFSGNGPIKNVYLPTNNNESKVPWDTIPTILKMPEHIKSILNTWSEASAPKVAPSVNSSYEPQHSFNLAPMVEKQLIRPDTIDRKLFGIITPKAFRSNLYKQQKYLHPNQVEDGRGNEYLSKISAILASDISIDKELYTKMMYYINEQWEYPMPQAKVKNLITHMLTSAQIDGTPIWKYNNEWDKIRFMHYNKVEQPVEYFVDPELLSIIEVNHESYITREVKDSKVKTILALMPEAGIKPNVKNASDRFKMELPAMHKVIEPHRDFGQLADDRFKFNMFKPTRALEVIRNPEAYASDYTVPTAFIEYLDRFQPNEEDRNYLMSHLLTKLLTFEYSAVIYYFVGRPGSGKGTFSKLLAALVGTEYVKQDLGKSEGLGIYNAWLKDIYFATFEEMNDKLTRSEAKQFNGQLKTWSGSSTFSCRAMNTDHVQYPTTATFILNQNGDTFELDPTERRIMYMYSPDKADINNIVDVIDLIDNHIEDIAYYIATKFNKLTPEEYHTPLMNDAKRASINDKLPLGNKLLTILENKDWDTFFGLINDSGIDKELFKRDKEKSRIYIEALGHLYCALAGKEYDRLSMVTKFRLLAKDNPKFEWLHNNNEAYYHFIPWADAEGLSVDDLTDTEEINI